MPALNRIIAPRGPKFFVDQDAMMFVLYLDGSTREGPRAATREDSLAHPDAWSAFVADVEAQEEARHEEAPPHPWRPLIEAITPDDHVDEGSVGDGSATPSRLQQRRAAAQKE